MEGLQRLGQAIYHYLKAKNPFFKGGIHGVAFVRGKGVHPGRVSRSLMHITDIYPTILALAGLNSDNNMLSSYVRDYLKTLDGFNVWDTISKDGHSSRREVLVNIDPRQDRWGESLYPDIFDTGIRAAIIYKKWKLITGFGHMIYAQKVCPEIQTPEYIHSKLNKTGNVDYWASRYWAEKILLEVRLR